MTLTCDWKAAIERHFRMAPDTELPTETLQFHADHGDDDLSQCDAWICECGNSPHRQGFHAEPCLCGDDQPHECGVGVFAPSYRCDKCDRVYTSAGREIGG